MIEIKHLFFNIGRRTILNNINCTLPNTGLVFIMGPSGCGKTSLLNCISGLVKYSGYLAYNKFEISNVGDEKKAAFRAHKIGFVFQDFKLFENEDIKTNILFNLESISNESANAKERRLNEVLRIVGLKNNLSQKVETLSGGEKQRVAIARAIITSPRIILADEPTGALDDSNADNIMFLLMKLSTTRLVVVVTHDESYFDKFGGIAIHMDNGRFESCERKNTSDPKGVQSLFLVKKMRKKPQIRFSFLIKHISKTFKVKKWRSLITFGVISLGLIGIGLSSTLSSSISKNIKYSYSSVVEDNKVMVSLRNNTSNSMSFYSSTYEEVSRIKDTMPEKIKGIGVCYKADFDSFFPDIDELIVDSPYARIPLDGFNVQSINNYELLNTYDGKIYPTSQNLNKDEIVLSLTMKNIQNICYSLMIERSIESLSKYISNNALKVYFDFANDSWQYEDQQIFTVKGFFLSNKNLIYHSEYLWNEYVLEECMRFPSNASLSEKDVYPWTLKKLYYLDVYDKEDYFKYFYSLEENDGFIIEHSNQNYFPLIGEESNRFIVLKTSNEFFEPRYIKEILDTDTSLSNPVIGSNYGISIYPSNMLYGFSNNLFISSSENSLNEVIETDSKMEDLYNNEVSYPDSVLRGHFSKSNRNGVGFANILIENKPILKLNQIVISSSIEKRLFKNVQAKNSTLHLAYNTSSYKTSNGKIIKNYINLQLEIIDIIESDRFLLFHNEDWPLSFFHLMCGISMMNLVPSSVCLSSTSYEDSIKSITKMNKIFPQFEAVNPISNMNESVDKICNYIGIALLIMSAISTVIAVFLILITNNLFIFDNARDIGLSRCLGISKNESLKFVFTYSLMTSIISFLIASFELVIVSFVIDFVMNSSFSGGAVSIPFNVTSFALMLGLSLILGLFSSLLFVRKIQKLDPIEAMRM